MSWKNLFRRKRAVPEQPLDGAVAHFDTSDGVGMISLYDGRDVRFRHSNCEPRFIPVQGDTVRVTGLHEQPPLPGLRAGGVIPSDSALERATAAAAAMVKGLVRIDDWRPVSEILQEVGLAVDGGTEPDKLRRLARGLAEREFPGGWWHGINEDDAHESINACLTSYGIPAVVERGLIAKHMSAHEGRVETDTTEDALRLEVIRVAAESINGQLDSGRSGLHLVEFAWFEGWPTDEPVWLFITSAERDQLAAVLPPAG